MENTCKTCINNDDGLCDRKGILVEDEDSCEHHWAAGKKIRMKRREKKMDYHFPDLHFVLLSAMIRLKFSTFLVFIRYFTLSGIFSVQMRLYFTAPIPM